VIAARSRPAVYVALAPATNTKRPVASTRPARELLDPSLDVRVATVIGDKPGAAQERRLVLGSSGHAGRQDGPARSPRSDNNRRSAGRAVKALILETREPLAEDLGSEGGGMQTRWALTLVLAGLLAIGGCASSQAPVLYPNEKLKQAGPEQADRAIGECRQLADAYVQSTAGKDVAKGAAVGGVAGAAIGAVGGAVSGRGAGAGAAVGAATGATAGAVHGAVKQTAPSPVYKAYVNRCLRERGYEVIGWQ